MITIPFHQTNHVWRFISSFTFTSKYFFSRSEKKVSSHANSLSNRSSFVLHRNAIFYDQYASSQPVILLHRNSHTPTIYGGEKLLNITNERTSNGKWRQTKQRDNKTQIDCGIINGKQHTLGSWRKNVNEKSQGLKPFRCLVQSFALSRSPVPFKFMLDNKNGADWQSS